MRDTEFRIVKDGQVVARVKIEIDYAKDKEVVKQIIAELVDVGDIEVWHNGMFVGLISSEKLTFKEVQKQRWVQQNLVKTPSMM